MVFVECMEVDLLKCLEAYATEMRVRVVCKKEESVIADAVGRAVKLELIWDNLTGKKNLTLIVMDMDDDTAVDLYVRSSKREDMECVDVCRKMTAKELYEMMKAMLAVG